MNFSIMLWFAVVALLALLSLKRAAWGVSLYMVTFFIMPKFWWWGSMIAGFRWSLYAGLALLVSVIVSRFVGTSGDERLRPPQAVARFACWLAAGLLINATVVHFLLTEDTQLSSRAYFQLAKFVLLFFMIIAAVRTKLDYRIIMLSIPLAAGYIGYEATINERGKVRANRLEGIGAPGADGANQLASLMVTVLPIGAAAFVIGRWWEKLLIIPTSVFTLNVVILCNSRGGFLGCIVSCLAMICFSPRRARKKLMKVLCLAGLAGWVLLGDPRIVDRFLTTFTGGQQRDQSASDRLVYWKAGLRIISDFPLGTGGDGFKELHGPRYLAEMGAYYYARAVHNGYINEACEWGIQGLLLRIAFILAGLIVAIRTVRCRQADESMQVAACALAASTMAFLVTITFGDFLDAEWGYWLIALAVAQERLVGRNFDPATTGLSTCAQEFHLP